MALVLYVQSLKMNVPINFFFFFTYFISIKGMGKIEIFVVIKIKTTLSVLLQEKIVLKKKILG